MEMCSKEQIRAEPKSLFQLCVRSVADNVGIWCRQRASSAETDETSGQRNGLRRIGKRIARRKSKFKQSAATPCDFLPASVLECILDEISQHGSIAPEQVTFFMISKLRKLDLSCVHGNIQPLLRRLPFACPELQYLDLSFQTLPDCFFDLMLPQLIHLHTLILNYTNCHSKHVKRLADSPLNLRILRLKGCTDIDDESLCHLLSEQRHLDELNLENVFDAHRSTCYFLPLAKDIRILEYEPFVEALSRTFQPGGLTIDNSAVYRNEHVRWAAGFRGISPIIGSLHLICPHISRLDISWDFAPSDGSDWLQSIAHLSNLRQLSLQGCWLDNQPTVFNAALISMLRDRGPTLRTLSLSVVRGVSIRQLALCCPNLSFLKLKTCKLASESDWTTNRAAGSPFQCLERVTIKYTNIQSAEDWACLLTPQLRQGTLHSTLICDDVLSLCSACLKGAQYLAFVSCPRVGVQGALGLMSHLTGGQLILTGCGLQSSERAQELGKLAADRNIQLRIM